MCPRGQRAAVQVGWVVAVESQGICSRSAGWPTFHLSDLCASGLGIWDHTVGGIWGLQVAVAEAQWVVWESHPGSNGQLHCCGTGPGTEGTGPRVEAGPLPPRSPFKRRRDENSQGISKSKMCLFYLTISILWNLPDL